MGRAVVIVDYNPKWPEIYQQEKNRILQSVGDYIVTAEHVGSTSVPGLGAKPIIDIMLGVRQLEDALKCIPALSKLGYEYRSEFDPIIPERKFFKNGTVETADKHLHIVEPAGNFWKVQLLFRDYLRNHPRTAQEYFLIKKKLSEQFAEDRDAYTNAKSPYIESILEKARAELSGT